MHGKNAGPSHIALRRLIFDRSRYPLFQFLVPEIVSLAEDPAWRVRRHAAWNMRAVFRSLSGSERLLDAFLRLVEVRPVSLRLIGQLSISSFISLLSSLRVYLCPNSSPYAL